MKREVWLRFRHSSWAHLLMRRHTLRVYIAESWCGMEMDDADTVLGTKSRKCQRCLQYKRNTLKHRRDQ